MRDLDRVRDKIEVRLEPRQVVMLAIGTMVFSGLLFAAGFMLGRSRAPVAPSPTLALGAASSEAVEAGDTGPAPVEVAAIGEVTFEFPTMLGSRPGREVSRRRTMRLDTDVVSVKAGEAEAKKIEARAAAEKAAAREAEKAAAEKIAKAALAPKPAPVEKPAPVARVQPAASPEPALQPVADEDDPDAAVPEPVAAPAPPKPAAVEPVAVAPKPSPAPAASDARYTLQVKAARDKAEADAFIADLRRSGFQPHMVLADVPGKGRFYRIRVGHFGSMGEARAFQRQYKRQSGQPDGGFVTDL